MLEFEIAAIYYFIASVVTATPYFEEVPEDFLTPCIFYPTPEPDASLYSTGAFATRFVMYIKFMDHDTLSAYNMAAAVLKAVMEKRNKIPLIDEMGKLTGKHFRVNAPKVKKIEQGVYQMELSWSRYTRYEAVDIHRAQNIFINGAPIS